MQSFETVNPLSGVKNDNAVSFESISQPGYYITAKNGGLELTDGSDKEAATFYLDEAPEVAAGASNNANLKTVEDVSGKYKFTKSGNTFTTQVPFETSSISIKLTAADEGAYICEDASVSKANAVKTIDITSDKITKKYTVLANDRTSKVEYTIIINKEKPDYSKLDLKSKLVKYFTFDGSTNGAVAVQKPATAGAPVLVSNPKYTYTNGVFGKAISLDGSYGLKLFENLIKSFGGDADTGKEVGNYSISFWMKPKTLGGVNDPVLTAGLFSPEWWLNLSFDAKVWSRRGAYINTPAANAYKAGVWQNVVLTVEKNKEDSNANSIANLYVDGVLVSTGDIEKDVMNLPTGAMYFGINAWDAIYSGEVDEVTCFNSTLNVTEVSALASKNASISSILANNTTTTTTTKTITTQTAASVAASKVTASVKNYPLINKKLTLKKGKKATIKASVSPEKASQKVKYTSSNKKVASVSSKGVIKAKKVGTCKITIKTSNGKKTVIKLKVVKKNKTNKVLKLKATKKNIKKSASYQIAIKKLTANTTSTISYKSSAKSKVSVDNTGLVKGKKKGKATITVKCGKAKAKIKIVVK